ncbi:MAG TPA: hypothetical protein VIR31_02535 [Nitrososphaeraceae archaeon]
MDHLNGTFGIDASDSHTTGLCGEIAIRAGFRFQCPQGREGWIPFTGTIE